jgi:hypothetical protein
MVEELLRMAEVEWDHERYFRLLIAAHWGLRWLRPWPELPPREALRTSSTKAA